MLSPVGNLQPYGHIESGASPVVRVGLPVPKNLSALAGKATEREAKTVVGIAFGIKDTRGKAQIICIAGSEVEINITVCPKVTVGTLITKIAVTIKKGAKARKAKRYSNDRGIHIST